MQLVLAIDKRTFLDKWTYYLPRYLSGSALENNTMCAEMCDVSCDLDQAGHRLAEAPSSERNLFKHSTCDFE